MLDLTVVSIPVYFGTMAAEHRHLRATVAERGPTAGDYQPADTATSLAMGLGSLVAPLLVPRLVAPLVPGKGRYGRALVGGVVAAVAVTSLADRLAGDPAAIGRDAGSPDAGSPATGSPAIGSPGDRPPAGRARRRGRIARLAGKVRRVTGPAAVAGGALAVSTAFAARTNPTAQWKVRGSNRDRGAGPLAWAAAIAGWDFVYYWNHRISHEVRALWAIHVIHHSSERYNLSTALRQPVSDVLGLSVPYGVMSRFGIRPHLVSQARAINLLYQYWVHTETIDRIGAAESVLNTPSHHRVHHGSQRQYLDRNHGSILIVWDKLFGSFEPEDERVVYGLTTNIETFNPLTVATHEYRDIVRDVAGSTNWRDRLSFVLRGPGWAYRRHRALSGTPAEIVAEPSDAVTAA